MSAATPQPATQPTQPLPGRNRSPLAHLLHALNQPLTGLECSLELATAGPRTPEQYNRVLREGLELTLRMRILVETLRELADTQEQNPQPAEVLRLDALLRDTSDDLAPVAQSRKVQWQIASDAPLQVWGSHRPLTGLMFRLLESALSLTPAGGQLEATSVREREKAVLRVSWSKGPPPEHSPFSRPELGLLIAQVGWERAGAEWLHSQAGGRQTCTLRMPLAAPENERNPRSLGDRIGAP